MLLRFQLSTVRIALLAAFVLASAGGCKLWNPFRDDVGFPKDEQKLTEGVRPADAKNSQWGASERAREIEKNLGVGPR